MPGWAFDRAVEYYDATRSLPPDVGAQVTELLAAELAGRERVLEIGVGTGRIALPLHARGVPLIGADIARPMLERLVANAGGHQPFPIVLADATALPFADETHDVVLASHVLHLIPPWTAAVDEAMRVLAPGGALLVDFGGGPPSPWTEGVERVMGELGVHHVRPGVSVADEVARHVGARAGARELASVPMTVRRSLAENLDQWERQQQSWTWQYPTEQIAAACDAVRRWAGDEGIALDDKVELDNVITWWSFDKPVRPAR
ncbi:MAG TPA: class I SAM-dependent methyltransferase [Acidimicrobiales bacterium]|nr:class I SAM-dependent methyltransferase [Acidimicrobiales bacterium]